jgi:hypothetical protein|tara:strand:- start:77 stop:730 length:654 start_codon:yes stop_codon:yes gene_type:complete
MSKAIESYEKLGKYISDDGFTFDISNEPTIEDFEKVIGEKTILVAKCAINTEEYFLPKRNKNGKLAKNGREYYNANDDNYDGKKVDYIDISKSWINDDEEWLYCLVYDGRVVKIGMTITSLKDRYGSYSCGTGRAMKKGSCSTTNFIISECNAFAITSGVKVEIYGIAVPKPIIEKTRFGVTKQCVLSSVRDEETMLIESFKNAYLKKPVLCVQEGK